jgi:hypothetical protein
MAIRTYHDFVIFAYNVETNAHDEVERFTVRVFSSPIGEGEEEEVVETPDYGQLKLRSRELERREMDQDVSRQMELGDRLGQLLLPENYARRLFRRSLDWLQPDEGLRLRLRLPKELADLPWEYMLVQKVGGERKPSDFVTLDSRISIVRHEALAIPARWFEPTDNRRVLVVMASPQPFEDYPRLKHLPDEQRFIKQALDDVAGVTADYEPEFGEGIGDGVIPSAQSRDVSSALRAGADIFHFSGHGEFVKSLGPSGDGIIGAGGIILADENNRAVPVSADRLLEIIRHHGVRLVVMGACETARRDTVYDWSSVALSLLKGEIPAVIAMQFTVYDPLTALFMGDFYQALSAGLTIDEAVYLGRWAVREATQLDKPDIRDWGAPVLYMRTPGGSIFPPVTDEVARQRAQDRSNGRFQVHQTSYRWMDRGGTASRDELQDLEGRREQLGLEPTQALLLLRSAVAADTPEKPWLDELRKVKGEQLILHLDDSEPSHPTGPEGTLRVLGLDPGTLEGRSKQIGPVAWSAAKNEDSFTRRTAALSLLALEPSPTEGLKRLERALDAIKGWWLRWRRGAELWGTLADSDPQVEKHNKLSPLDRLGAWLWRVWRRALRDRQRIFARTVGGALGAGLALGIWRALIAAVGRSQWPVHLFIYSYLGAILGLFTALGMSLADPTLLRRREEKRRPSTVARRGILLGILFFGFWHFITALLNALDLAVRPWMPLTGLLVGVGVSLALYDQPRAGRRLGLGGWLLRLGTATLTAALAQTIIFWVGGNYEATSISFDANYYFRFYRRYDVIRIWMENTLGWEQVVMTVDTALAGLVLTLGMTFGLTAAPRWLAWWRKTTGGDEGKSKEGV